jgi:hypothetical protein
MKEQAMARELGRRSRSKAAAEREAFKIRKTSEQLFYEQRI